MAATTSLCAAIALWFAADSPDGRDPFYIAVSIEFAVWGAIDAMFAIAGAREVSGLAELPHDERDSKLEAKAQTLRRLLRVSARLNVLWLAIAVILFVWGYRAWSASLVGHGAGVLVQAMVLVVLDRSFVVGLEARAPASER